MSFARRLNAAIADRLPPDIRRRVGRIKRAVLDRPEPAAPPRKAKPRRAPHPTATAEAPPRKTRKETRPDHVLSPPNRFAVQVEGLEHLLGTERKIVFHGVNKSGSLVMTNVLCTAYYEANRANQFFSTYRNVPTDEGHLRRILNASTGHSFFGAHYLYGAYTSRPDEHVLTTQFRNPLPRVRSCYQWLKNKADAQGQAFAPFDQWVLETRGVLHSQTVQFALGFGAVAREQSGTIGGEEALECALVNIERDVQWFGIAEYFEESAFAMAAICGLPTLPPWQRDNRNKDRPLVMEWPDEQVELVRDVFRWDFMLYEWAVERFQRNLAGLRFGPELERYKLACVEQYKDRLGTDGADLVYGPPRSDPGPAGA